MGKELLLVRHAEARGTEVGRRDTERELSPRGYQDATRLGYYLYQRKQNIDLLLASTARRAQHTAEILTEQMHYEARRMHLSDKLYQASVRSMLEVINEQADEINCLMIVGHNPTLTYLTEYLTEEAISGIEPGGMFTLDITTDTWLEVTQHSAILTSYLGPDQLRQK